MHVSKVLTTGEGDHQYVIQIDKGEWQTIQKAIYGMLEHVDSIVDAK